MKIFNILKQVVVGLSTLCLAYSLPTLTTTSPSLTTTSTPSLTTTSKYLEPNPCGGINPAPGHVTDDEVQESLNELKPVTSKIINTVSDFKAIMGSKRIQSQTLMTIAEKFSTRHYPDEIFPYFPENDYSERNGLFGEIYRNGSIIEIYHTQMKDIEKMKDNDAEFIQYSTDIITDVQLLRCHLQIVSRYFNEPIPSIEFSVPEDKIDDDNDSHRYIKHYQISHMTQKYLKGLEVFFDF